MLIGGAAINRDFGRRVLYPNGRENDEIYEPGVFYCKDAFQGLDTMDALIEPETREALVQKLRDEAETFRNKPVEVDDGPPVTDDSVRSAADPDAPIPAHRHAAAPSRHRQSRCAGASRRCRRSARSADALRPRATTSSRQTRRGPPRAHARLSLSTAGRTLR